MADLILVGNPNAGKSTIFNRLTRGNARVGNWHGVTVDVLEGKMQKRDIVVADIPGVYSAEGRSLEEKFACRYLSERPDAALLFVAEYANIERTVPLIAELTKGGRRCALALTKRKTFEREGGFADIAAISARLGIAVFPAEGKYEEKVAAIVKGEAVRVPAADLSDLCRPVREGLSRADRLLMNGWFGIPLFFMLLFSAFFFTFAKGSLGDLMKRGVEWIFSDLLAGYCEAIPSAAVRSLLRDGILRSTGSVLCFLPQIALLHLFLILLEESGLLSRLAVLTDGFFSAVGLSGRAVFSLLMGFGCTAAAVTTTRGLDDRRMQRRVILCLPYLSCSAKLPVYLALSASFFRNPFLAVSLLYVLGAGVSLCVALFFKEKTSPFLAELAPLQLPRPLFVAKSLLFQIKQFIMKVATVILAFFLASWLLSSFDFSFTFCTVERSMLATLCGGLKFLFAPIGMNDWRIAYAALSGLVAKENVAGAIAMFYGAFPYSGASAFSFAVFILTCSPCVSAIAATARELGARRAMLYAAGQTVSALLFSYAAYFCLTGGGVYVALAAAPVFAVFLVGRRYDKTSRKTKRHAQRIHRRELRAGVDVSAHALEAQRYPRKREEDGGKRLA